MFGTSRIVFKSNTPKELIERYADLEYWHVTSNFVLLALNNKYGTIKALELLKTYLPVEYRDYHDAIDKDMKSNYSYMKNVFDVNYKEKKQFLKFMCKYVDVKSSYFNMNRSHKEFDRFDQYYYEPIFGKNDKYLYPLIIGVSYKENEMKDGGDINPGLYRFIRSYFKLNCHNKLLEFI